VDKERVIKCVFERGRLGEPENVAKWLPCKDT
jgi:hypothetical protein